MKHLSIIFSALLIANSVSSSTEVDQLFKDAAELVNLLPKIRNTSSAVLDQIDDNIKNLSRPVRKLFNELETLLNHTDAIDDPKIKQCRVLGQELSQNVRKPFQWIRNCFIWHREKAHEQVEKLFKYVDDLYARLASIRDKTHNKCIHGVKGVLQVPGGFLCAGSQMLKAVTEIPDLVDRAVRTTASLALLPPAVATCTTFNTAKTFLTYLSRAIRALRKCVKEVAGHISQGVNDKRLQTTTTAKPITEHPFANDDIYNEKVDISPYNH